MKPEQITKMVRKGQTNRIPFSLTSDKGTETVIIILEWDSRARMWDAWKDGDCSVVTSHRRAYVAWCGAV